ncbi:MAG: hypothetical protein IAE88_01495 [Rhodobacteraceae bacterium]|nr:hypothetical protein [Paracoccaceae bacterium]
MRTVHYLLLGVFVAATAAAQPVYETRDKDGPVFSDLPSQGRDLPSPGATELTLPPLNVGEALPAPAPVPEQEAPAAVVMPYRSLSVSQPASGGTIHSNTGQFPVEITIDPALRTRQGDVIVVKLDDQELPARRTTTKFDITADDWQMAAVDSVEHQLQVAVLDLAGKLLIVSQPVRFFVHRASRR